MSKGWLLALLLIAGPALPQDGKELIELLQKGGYNDFFSAQHHRWN